MTRAVAIIPAYQAERTLLSVIQALKQAWHDQRADTPYIIVVDDGSRDATAEVARATGVDLVQHTVNRGKGAALRTGLSRARHLGYELAVTLDADAQHPAAEAVRLLSHPATERALVLGIRNLSSAGAPRKNQWSNAFSNLWLSGFSGQWLGDTQCGMRRYPVGPTLELDARANGYGFEAEIILLAARAGWPIEQVPVGVYYPPEAERITHFHSVRDPFKIVLRVLYTAALAKRG